MIYLGFYKLNGFVFVGMVWSNKQTESREKGDSSDEPEDEEQPQDQTQVA